MPDEIYIEFIGVVQAPEAPGCPSADGVQSSADLLRTRQSGFRPGHSTETAVLRVLSDILLTLDSGDRDLAALILLDLMAAFDTVDHVILLQRLQRSFGIKDVVLQWYQSADGTAAVRTTRRCYRSTKSWTRVGSISWSGSVVSHTNFC